MAFKQFGGGFRGNDRSGGFGGRSGNDRGGDRPRFANKGFSGGGHGGGDRDSRQAQMHSATCAKCNKTCEVPFRPNGERPVFCKDCFGSQRDSFGGDNRRGDTSDRGFQKRDSSPSHSFVPATKSATDNMGLDELKKLVEAMNKKLDIVIEKMNEDKFGAQVSAAVEKVKPEVQAVVDKIKPEVKAVVKKAKQIVKKVAKKIKK